MESPSLRRLLEWRRPECIVIGRFKEYHGLETAARLMKASHLAPYDAFGPVPLTELEEHMQTQGSFVRNVATIGGVAGAVGGFALAAWSSSLFNLVVGGKPPVAFVPFAVVAYECTILIACISTFVATGHAAKFFPISPPEEFDERYSHDLFGLHVYCASTQVAEAKRMLEEAGADEIDEI